MELVIFGFLVISFLIPESSPKDRPHMGSAVLEERERTSAGWNCHRPSPFQSVHISVMSPDMKVVITL